MTEESNSSFDFAVDKIRSQINARDLVPGQRVGIPSLARELDARPSLIRQALRELASAGLIVVSPEHGHFIRKLSTGEVAEIFRTREAIDPLAAELAADHIAIGANRVMLTAARDAGRIAQRAGHRAYVDHSHRLHRLIYKLTANATLVDTAERLMMPLYELGYQHLMPPRYVSVAHAEHEKLIAAILAGDQRVARRKMRKHIQRSCEVMLLALR